MRYRIVYRFLLLLKMIARCFYTIEVQWVGKMPEDPWQDYRLVAVLNHTSLYEFLFAGIVPNKFLWRMAHRGIIPIASKTMERPLIGKFWAVIAGNVVPISRERDETWKQVIESVDPRSMVVILPEGRMKRRDGNDSFGRPLTVRGGISDLVEAIPEGRMLLAYSQGLHHIHIPDHSFFPRLFQPIRMRIEVLDIGEYRQTMREQAMREQNRSDESTKPEPGTEPAASGKPARNRKPFARAVVRDVTRRRDFYCTSNVGERGEVGFDRMPPPSPE